MEATFHDTLKAFDYFFPRRQIDIETEAGITPVCNLHSVVKSVVELCYSTTRRPCRVALVCALRGQHLEL